MHGNLTIVAVSCFIFVGFFCVLPGCGTSATWEYVVEPSDKPGCALVLNVEKGLVVSAEMILLGSPPPKGGILHYSIQNLRHSGNVITGEFDLVNMGEPSHVRLSIVLSKPLEGSGPVSAIMKTSDDREGQEIVFVRK